jgi:hypothetical protein
LEVGVSITPNFWDRDRPLKKLDFSRLHFFIFVPLTSGTKSTSGTNFVIYIFYFYLWGIDDFLLFLVRGLSHGVLGVYP